jgi:anti-anti-sigma factor
LWLDFHGVWERTFPPVSLPLESLAKFPTGMLIQSELHDAVFIVRPQGDISKLVAAELNELLEAAIDDGAREIIFDSSALTQMSSDGLRVVLKTLRRLHGVGGRIAIAAAGDRVRAVMKVSGILGLLDVHDTVDDALASKKVTQPS